MPTFQTVRGMRDLLDQEAQALTGIISKARETALLYGYREVITPVVESFELLNAKAGEEIRKRMFIFKDLGDRNVALRPEFTASIARITTTALKNEPKPLRLFSAGSVYRYDEPQRGRFREFWQSNFELIGSNRPEADAEILLLTDSFLKSLGLRGFAFKLGHMGVLRGILGEEDMDEKTQNAIFQRMDKKEYQEAFKLAPTERCRRVLEGLLQLRSDDCFETVEKIKCYVAGNERARVAVENLDDILKLVVANGCPVKVVEPGFARGLEYYTGMIFEVYTPELDIALGGGGRYDKLIELFGGEPTPAVGCAHGIDRVALALQAQENKVGDEREKRVLVFAVNDALKVEALKIAQSLRQSGVIVEFEVMGRRMAKALEDADKRRVDYAVIVGERELKEDAVMLRNLAKREQNVVPVKELAEKINS
ncbi:MAG TPA: histidine--tRNA ligase [Candidatus Limnocylindrales bacterium]|nr:histidine--tRNA ligase [Candidatus Limnocylindrales bacterium]